MDHAVIPITQIRDLYVRARGVSKDHEEACRAVALHLGIAVESVRDAVAQECAE